MNHQEFLNKWLGGKYRETVQLGYQCAGMVKLYAKERGREQIGYFGGVGAYQGWVNDNNTFNPKFYDKIPNTISAVPDQGDIIIFKADKTNGYHGHIGIVDSATKTYVRVCEQNGGQGKGEGVGTDAIRIRKYPYTNVVGRYHYNKQLTAPIQQPVMEESPIDSDIQLLIDDGIWNGNLEPMDRMRMIKIIAKTYKKLKQ